MRNKEVLLQRVSGLPDRVATVATQGYTWLRARNTGLMGR